MDQPYGPGELPAEVLVVEPVSRDELSLSVVIEVHEVSDSVTVIDDKLLGDCELWLVMVLKDWLDAVLWDDGFDAEDGVLAD